MSRKIIIDTDPGIDDAMAILFALAAPLLQGTAMSAPCDWAIEVVGLTTIYGNVHTARATQNALHLLEVADRADIPVAHGADRPLVVPYPGPAEFVHGADGLGNIDPQPPTIAPHPLRAAEFIVETVMTQPGEITLVPIGPLTNLALALLLEPRIVDHVAEVVLMGGAATVNGNVNPAAEANIYHDPHAADMVFTAGWPLTMVGLDVTTKVRMDALYLEGLCQTGKRTGDYINAICQFYLAFHRQSHQLNATYTHDPSAIAYLIAPWLFTTEQGPIRVVTEGVALGHTLFDRRGHWGRPNAWSTQRPVNVCVDVDEPGLLDLYQRVIHAAP